MSNVCPKLFIRKLSSQIYATGNGLVPFITYCKLVTPVAYKYVGFV